MGLSRQDHGELNKWKVNPKIYDELRQKYQGDHEALKQIDIYDPNTEYHVWFRKYRDALLRKNRAAIFECEEWFKGNGY